MKNISIYNWPLDDRPREKLRRQGLCALSNAELLAILFSSGARGKNAVALAREMMVKFRSLRGLTAAPWREWQRICGIGWVKFARFQAAAELGRRLLEETVSEQPAAVQSARDIVRIMKPRMQDLTREIFTVVFLNARNSIIDSLVVEEGTVNCAYPIIREIVRPAIERQSAGIICLHNHPSGNPQPSREDTVFTRQLQQAADVLNIKVVDHVIIAGEDFYSFADNGLL